MNVKGYDVKERFEFGVITSFAYPIEDSGKCDASRMRKQAKDQMRD